MPRVRKLIAPPEVAARDVIQTRPGGSGRSSDRHLRLPCRFRGSLGRGSGWDAVQGSRCSWPGASAGLSWVMPAGGALVRQCRVPVSSLDRMRWARLPEAEEKRAVGNRGWSGARRPRP